jgi:hypothetical protein
MENTEKFDANRKLLIKTFRNKVMNGQFVTRETFLAYAYLRDREYESLEYKIQEDTFGKGKWTFIQKLSSYISWTIVNTATAYKLNLDSNYKLPSNLDIMNWIMVKYSNSNGLQELC